MRKECVVCGEEFQAPPSSKKITCGKLCSSIRKSESHRGKTHPWSAPARQRLRERGQTINLTLGTEAARRSPVSGPFPTNRNALVWTIESPEGKLFTMRNLNRFIRTHPTMFDGTLNQARSGFTQMRRSQQGKTKRPVSQWKGWRLHSVGK